MKRFGSILTFFTIMSGCVFFYYMQNLWGSPVDTPVEEEVVVVESSEESAPATTVTVVSPKTTGEVDILISFPFFGTIKFKATRDEESSTISAKFPAENTPFLTVGPLVIESGDLSITSEGVLSYLGRAKFFGKSATIGLKKFELMTVDDYKALANEQREKEEIKYQAAHDEWQNTIFGQELAKDFQSFKTKIDQVIPVEKEVAIPTSLEIPGQAFDFKFIKRIVFTIKLDKESESEEIIPGAKVTLKSVDLVLDRFSIPQLKFKVKIFGQSVTFSVFLDRENQEIITMAALKQCRVDVLLPDLKDSPIGALEVSGYIRATNKTGLSFMGRFAGDGKGGKSILELIPGMPVSLDEFKIDFGRDKKIAINMAGTFLGKSVLFDGLLNPSMRMLTLTTSLKGYQLGDIIPSFKESELNKLVFEGLMKLLVVGKISTQSSAERGYLSFFSRQPQSVLKSPFSPGVPVAPPTSGILLNGKVKSASGEKFDLFDVKFTGDGSITLDTMTKSAVVSGTINSLGLKLVGNLSLRWGAISEVKLTTSLGQGVNEWKPFAEIAGSSDALKPLKDLVIYDLKVGSDIGFSKQATALKAPAKSPEKTAAEVAEEKAAQAAMDKDREVFETIKVDPLKKSTDSKGFSGSVYVTGKAQVFGVVCEITAKVSKISGQDLGVLLIAGLPQGWKMQQSFPELFKDQNPITDAINSIKLNQARLMLSSYRDMSLRADVGVTLEAAVDLTGSGENLILKTLQALVSKTGDRGAGAILIGQIDPLNPRTASLKVGLSAGDFTIAIPPVAFRAATLYLLVRGEPKLAFAGSLEMIPAPNIPPLQWGLEAGFTMAGLGFDISMLGKWPDPLGVSAIGIKNFEVADLGFKWYTTYEAIAAALSTGGTGSAAILIPAIFGLSGKVAIGSPDPVQVEAAFGFGVDVTNCFIDLKVKDAITIAKFSDTIRSMMGLPPFPDVLTWKMAPLVLDGAFFRLVPSETTIGDIKFRKGIGGGAKIRMFGKTVDFGLSIDTMGISGHGIMDPLVFGPFELTNFDGPGGPAVELTLHLEKGFTIELDGRLKLGDLINSRTKFLVSATRGLAFETESSIGPKEAGISARIKGVELDITDPMKLLQALDPKNIGLTIEFTNKLTERLNADIGAVLERQKQALKNDIDGVIVQLRSNATIEQIRAQEKRVHEAEARRVWFFENPFLSIERELEVTKANIALNQLRDKYYAEKTDVGRFIGKTLQDLGIPMFVQDVLKIIQNIGAGVYEGGQFVFKNVSNLLVVRSIYWSGSASDLAQGIIPGVKVAMVLMGKEIDQNLGDFDLRDPVGSSKRIADNLVKIVQNTIMDSLGKVH